MDLDELSAGKLLAGGVRVAVSELIERLLDLQPHVLGHPERLQPRQHLQGYLDHKKPHPPRTLQ